MGDMFAFAGERASTGNRSPTAANASDFRKEENLKFLLAIQTREFDCPRKFPPPQKRRTDFSKNTGQ